MRSNTALPGLRHGIRINLFLTVTVCLVLAPQYLPAQTYSVLHSFEGPPDGKYPDSVLTKDAKGNVYGTTFWGGGSYGGTVFRLDSNGTESILYNFLAGYGAHPNGDLIRDEEGNLYGATTGGGDYGMGAVFRLDKKGNENVLYSFKGTRGDGAEPASGPIRDADGNLYGTTTGGGRSKNGTVYKIDRTGRETILHRFTGGWDGSIPYGSLARDDQGNLYGTTGYGGNGGGCDCGGVFKINTAGRLTVLYGFTGKGGDGNVAYAGVILDETGNLYGTTLYGGNLQCGYPSPGGCGIVYKVDPAGKETVLYAFSGTDGEYPAGGVVHDVAGNLYGTTLAGGDYDYGTVFKLDSTGKLAVLHSFNVSPDGNTPWAGVFLDPSGALYGTTEQGGDHSWGIVYELVP